MSRPSFKILLGEKINLGNSKFFLKGSRKNPRFQWFEDFNLKSFLNWGKSFIPFHLFQRKKKVFFEDFFFLNFLEFSDLEQFFFLLSFSWASGKKSQRQPFSEKVRLFLKGPLKFDFLANEGSSKNFLIKSFLSLGYQNWLKKEIFFCLVWWSLPSEEDHHHLSESVLYGVHIFFIIENWTHIPVH